MHHLSQPPKIKWLLPVGFDRTHFHSCKKHQRKPWSEWFVKLWVTCTAEAKGHLKKDGGNTNIFLYRIHQLLNSIPNFMKIQDIQTRAAGKPPGHSILKLFWQFWPEHRLQVWYLHINLPIHYWEISMLTVMVTRTKQNFHRFTWFFHRQLNVLIFWNEKYFVNEEEEVEGKTAIPVLFHFISAWNSIPTFSWT